MAQISSRKCDSCETETGKLYCYECKQFLCDPCKRFHDKFQKKHTTTDSHNVDRLTLSQQLTCEQHKEDFVHFCSSCECLTCSLCDTSAHKGHSLTQISEVVSPARENVKHLIDKLKKKIKTLRGFIEPIKTTKFQKLKIENKQYSSEVETTSEQIISIVKAVKETEMTRASDFLVIEKQQLEFTIAKLEKIYNKQISLISQLEQVLQLKHDVAFFLNQKTIIKQIEDLDDIPRNIEEPNEIEQLNKEDFAKSVVKHIQSQYNIDVVGRKDQNQLVAQLAALKQENDLLRQGQKGLERRSLTDDERIDALEEQLKEATYIAENADRRYDEAARKLTVAEIELERTEEKYEHMRRQVKQLEQDLHETSTSLRELEIREEKGPSKHKHRIRNMTGNPHNDRDKENFKSLTDSYDETIRDLTNRLTDAEARVDINERQCNSLQRENEKLQEDLDNEEYKRIAKEQEMERTLAELSAFKE